MVMLAEIHSHPDAPEAARLAAVSHVLILLPKRDSLRGLKGPLLRGMEGRLARRGFKLEELAKRNLTGELESGAAAVWGMVDASAGVFERLTRVRELMQPLLDDKPAQLAIVVMGEEAERHEAARLAVYAALVNSAPMPERKKEASAGRQLGRIEVFGCSASFDAERAVAEGNALARELTLLPANELTPARYREQLRELAGDVDWKYEEWDLKRLRDEGAGAFVAVAQGSPDRDAAIVRLGYRPKKGGRRVALVGKGICYDTGGHNLKPAKYMHGMHEDMNGSAVAVGLLLAATRQALPVGIDCWLAIAQNHISPQAYKQGDVVRAITGDTIEVVHTDAEGRMVLADTLALAARKKPAAIIDFATLTGSCIAALGTRYCGIFGNREALLEQALAAGRASGERVCAFPFDADYDSALDSKVADVKQCTLDGEADHILAARFLSRFVGDVPWLHVDLSAVRCEGGLGAVAGPVTGFGVAFGDVLLKALRD